MTLNWETDDLLDWRITSNTADARLQSARVPLECQTRTDAFDRYHEPPEEARRSFTLVQSYVDKWFATCTLSADWSKAQARWADYEEILGKNVVRSTPLHQLGQFVITQERQQSLNPHLKQIFRTLATSWYNDTGGYSVTTRRYAHPSYQAILSLGTDVVPHVLRELKERPNWWFDALIAVARPAVDPVPRDATFAEAVDAWIAWGKRNGFVE